MRAILKLIIVIFSVLLSHSSVASTRESFETATRVPGIVLIQSTYPNGQKIQGYGVQVHIKEGVNYVYTAAHISQGSATSERPGNTTISRFDQQLQKFVVLPILLRLAHNRRDSEVFHVGGAITEDAFLDFNGRELKLSEKALAFLNDERNGDCKRWVAKLGLFVHCGTYSKPDAQAVEQGPPIPKKFDHGLIGADHEWLVLDRIHPGMSGLPYLLQDDEGLYKFVGLASAFSRHFQTSWVIPEFFFEQVRQRHIVASIKQYFPAEIKDRFYYRGLHFWHLDQGVTYRTGSLDELRLSYREAAIRSPSGGSSRSDSGDGNRSDGGTDSANTVASDPPIISALKISINNEKPHSILGILVTFLRDDGLPTPMAQRILLPPDFSSMNVLAELKYMQLEGRGRKIAYEFLNTSKRKDFFSILNARTRSNRTKTYHLLGLNHRSHMITESLTLTTSVNTSEQYIEVTATCEGQSFYSQVTADDLELNRFRIAKVADKEHDMQTLDLNLHALFYDDPSHGQVDLFDGHTDFLGKNFILNFAQPKSKMFTLRIQGKDYLAYE